MFAKLISGQGNVAFGGYMNVGTIVDKVKEYIGPEEAATAKEALRALVDDPSRVGIILEYPGGHKLSVDL